MKNTVIIPIKKDLTNTSKGDRIYELSRRAGARYHAEVGRHEKKSKKLLKNPLTNGKESGIISRLSQRNGTAWHGETPDRLREQSTALIFEN